MPDTLTTKLRHDAPENDVMTQATTEPKRRLDEAEGGAALPAARGYASPLALPGLESESVRLDDIVADPPWDLKMGKTRTLNGESESWNDEKWTNIKDLEYPTMSIEEICALPVGKMADVDAHLYIWTINRYIEETYDVARAWGFEPSTMLYWLKQPMGLGLGGAFVPCVEPILFCRRGKLPVKARCDRNWWGWPRGKHSAKPEEFQTVVESVSPGPYLELFARRKRHGWASWGNEIASDVEMPNDQALRPAAGEPSEKSAARTAGSQQRVARRTGAALVREVERGAGAEPGETNL